MLKTVLFDLDGTLLDTEPDFTIILNALLQQHGYQQISAQSVRKTISDGARALIKLGFKINEEDDDFAHYLEAFLDLYLAQIEQTQCRLFSGVHELLLKLEANNIQWGIVTNKPARYTTPIIEKNNILQRASCIICPDHISAAKPSPEGLLLACSKIPCSPNQAIYVGDHPRDIEAGIHAQMPTIAVSWGYYHNEIPIDQWGANKIVANPGEIQDYLFASD